MDDPGTAQFFEQQRLTGNSLQYLASQLYYAYALRTEPRYQVPKSLVPHGYRIYSQNDEDGIIAEIMRRIGNVDRRFVEFGVGDGVENNSLGLLMEGWQGTWIDGSAENIGKIKDRCAELIRREQLQVEQAFIDAENVQDIFQSLNVPAEFSLLSVDIDGNDYWMWRALCDYRPKVVVIEYNAGMGPRAEWKQEYDPKWVWQGTRNFGASLKSFELLGREKGYCLVGCSIKGMNAFFVREDLVGERFQEPFTSEFHFEPPRYYLWFSTGHRKDPAEIKSFETCPIQK